MTRDYIETMQRKENLCRAYLQKAEDEFFEKQKHTPEEGRYLQEAIKLQYEMAQISDGEERKFHLRRQKELEQKFREVVQAVNPEGYQKVMDRRKERDSSKNEEVRPHSKKKEDSSEEKEEEISEETITNWFKSSPNHSFMDVAGMNELKEQLKECVVDTRLTKIRKYLKMRQLNSFFFIGPPGCGKTYIIEAFAHEIMEKGYKYLSLDGSDILSRYVGDAEKIIARLFEEAEKNAPCIVFIDEIDGVCKNRSLENLPVWASNMTTAFLTAYNRINSSDKPIIFIGATNYPSQVDNAMLDRVQMIRVPFPDLEARAHVFRLQFEEILGLEEEFTFHQMAEMTELYNYRDIDRLCLKVKNSIKNEALALYETEEAAIEAMERKDYVLTKEHFAAVQSKYTPSPKEEIIKELDAFEQAQNKKMEQE